MQPNQQEPAAPAPPPASGARIIRIEAGPGTPAQTISLPGTRAQVDELRARRSELSSQLQSASGRRQDLAEQLVRLPPGQARAGIEERLAVLDERIVQLERDIAGTGQQLTGAGVGLLAQSSSDGRGGMSDDVIGMMAAIFTVFVLFPIALSYARGVWKRSSRQPPALNADTQLRLERMEQSVDAIAVEIERISEGQRFVTRLLGEPRVGAGVPPTNPARLTEAIPARGGDASA